MSQEKHIMYVNDPSTIAMGLLPDPVSEEDLRGLVDMVADSGADSFVQDVYNQGFTVYFRSDRFQYDQREQHRRFLPLLDAGIQPVQVMLDHCHKRGMAFLAGFRMNDSHPIGTNSMCSLTACPWPPAGIRGLLGHRAAQPITWRHFVRSGYPPTRWLAAGTN